jgi:DNA polymerase theta
MLLLATPLGDGVVASGLSPTDALNVFQDLKQARSGVCLDTDLHLIYLATPVTGTPEPDWQRFLTILERLPVRERAVASAVGISHEFVLHEARGRRGPLPSASNAGGSGQLLDWRLERERAIALHRRFWAALALFKLLAEAPLASVAAEFRMPRGGLQAMQGQAVTYCSLVQQLCERLRWHEMAALFAALHPRLAVGASAEVLPLCRVPGVHAQRARLLLDAGYNSVEELARAPITAVERALSKFRQFESRLGDNQAARTQEQVIRKTARKVLIGAQTLVAAEVQKVEDEAEDEQRRVVAALAKTPTAARS